MLDDISKKVSEDVEESGKKRRRNNELILRLIESACQRLEDKIQ